MLAVIVAVFFYPKHAELLSIRVTQGRSVRGEDGEEGRDVATAT